MASPSSLSDAELHGLVDGCLPVERRADALRRAAASALDRTRIGAWQDQNDLIRAAFSHVVLEPLPASLDLRTPPRLQCVARTVPRQPDAAKARVGRRGFAAVLATIALVGGGLAGSWMLASEPSVPRVSSAGSTPPLASIEDEVAATLGAKNAESSGSLAPLPTAIIPDLTSAGYRFTGADATREQTDAVLFRYRNAEADRLVIGAVRASEVTVRGGSTMPVRIGRTYAWRVGDADFAIAGTPSDPRLREIALSLSQGSRGR